ncbi:DUF771 domain-containing protein [Companilactobacillus metriopterae]|uniref:DUF771 domain-containing protein n=1 Tax=Companilactobacillus metriopterae TaxID=1909267 RepID=UPI0013E8FC94|nr:DUF771 domain-containing protein [Companilactobacillus metriopterae]
MQSISEFETSILLPDDKVIVDREWAIEASRIVEEANIKNGVIKDLEWASEKTKLSKPTLTKILTKPRIRKLLDVDSGGCVQYSKGKGSPWKFHVRKFERFVDNNPQIFMKWSN